MIEALYNAVVVKPVESRRNNVWKHCSPRFRE